VVGELSKTEPQQPDALIGRKLDGRYEVLGRLGEGGVGVVYKGRQTQLGRLVAIKVLHQDAAAIPEWRRRFEREARALSALAHPNVVPVTDSGIDNGVSFLVMELLQGKTLGDLIKEGPLPLWRSLDIARQLLRGLAFAHGKGIVHRDLKPANVFLQALPDQADHVRLLDFGMAKFMDGSSAKNAGNDTLTRAGIVFGTPAYMSPEQAKGGNADARTDVYAAGILLFELLAGKRPFLDPTYEGIIMEHLTQPVPSLAKVRTSLTTAPLFQPIVDKAMAKKPSARFKDAEAMLVALEGVIAKLPDGALKGARRSLTPPVLRVIPSGARFFRRALAVVMLAGLVGAVGTYFVRDRVAPVATDARPGKPSKKVPPPSKPAPPPASALPAAPPPKPEPPPAPPAQAKAPDETAAPAKKPEPKAEPPEPAEAPKAQRPREPRENDRQPRSAARDPWKAPAPKVLRSIRDRVNHGAHMSQKALTPVYEYAHENPGDPRPWLLLGHAYAKLDWFSDAVDRYVKAYHVDSASRGDPQMLADLIKAAAHPGAAGAAARAVRDIYGADAIPALEKAMKARAGEREASARLTRLRESLR